MSIDPKIAESVQGAYAGALVILFEIDTSLIVDGGGTYCFSQAKYESGPIEFNGEIYWPLDCEATGFEFSGKGQLPQPSLKLGLIGSAVVPQTLRALIRQYGDLVGAMITRRRTFRKYLDDEYEEDALAQFQPDIYRIEQKVYQDNIYIEWKLSAYMDYEGKRLPARQVIRDFCVHVYRTWVSGTTFTYTKATCPYTGVYYFTADGEVTVVPGSDQCGKRLTDCKLRFPYESLPTRAFPGVARIRI